MSSSKSTHPRDWKGEWLRLRNILDTLPAMIFLKDRKNNIIGCNRFYEEVTGVPRDLETPVPASTLCDNEETLRLYWEADKKVFETMTPAMGIEEPLISDPKRWFRTDKIPFVSATGEVIGVLGFAIEITREKCAREQLEESEQRYRSLYENMVEGMAICEVLYDDAGEALDYVLVDVNPAYERIMGLKRSQVQGRRATDIYQRTHIPTLQYYARVDKTQTGENFQVERQGQCFNAWAYPVAPGRVASLFQDITEEQRHQAEMERSQQNLTNFFGALNDLLFVLDEAGNISFANPAVQDLLGHSLEALSGRPFQDLFPERFHRQVQSLALSPQNAPQRDILYPLLTESGDEIAVETRIVPGFWNEAPAFFAACRDISERLKTEHALRRERNFNYELIQASPAFIVALDGQGKILLANHALLAATAREEAEVLGKDFLQALVPRRQWEKLQAHLLDNPNLDGLQDLQNRILTREGTEIDVEWHARRIWDDEIRQNIIIAIGLDITERKRLLEVLYLQRDLAVTIGRTRGISDLMEIVLNAAIRITGIECVGVYLVDPEDQSLYLVCHEGLSEKFAASVARLPHESYLGKLVHQGKALYLIEDQIHPLDPVRQEEKTRAAGVVPVSHAGAVVACLTVASRSQAAIPTSAQHALEIMSGQIGDVVARVRSEEAVLQAIQKEQERIGQDLHDGLVQHLSGTAFMLELLIKRLKGKEVSDASFAEDILKNLRDAMAVARSYARGLYPAGLRIRGLPGALQDLVDATRPTTETQVQLEWNREYNADYSRLPEKRQVHLYRIAQEALHNAIRHGKPTRVEIRLDKRAQHLRLAISDNGGGFEDHQPSQPGMGLHSMRERAAAVGADLHIINHEKGVTVECLVPLEENEAPEKP